MKILKTLFSRNLNAGVAFCLSMALTLGATYLAYRISRIEDAGRFERTVINYSNTLRNRLMVYTNAILYTRNLFDIKPNLTREDFGGFVHEMRLRENFPGIQSIGYVRRMTRAQATQYLAGHGRTLEQAGSAKDAEEIDLVIFLEQLLETGISVLNMDLGISPERKSAMNQARDLGVPVATDRIRPLQTVVAASIPVVYAFVVYAPRYREGADISTVEARRKALLGFVYAGFRAKNLFGRVSDDVKMHNPDLAVRIYDGLKKDPERLMFSEGDFDQINTELLRSVEIQAANHGWTMEIAAPKNFGLTYLRWSPLFVFALGSMLSIAVMASLMKSDRLAAGLRIAREEADNANQAKSVFLANISHEIRTPLGVIIGFAESALTEDMKEKRDIYLNTILRNGNELARIIGDVLDLSKIEAKTLMVENNALSLKKINEELKSVWKPLVQAKGLEFSADISPALPEFIVSDGTRMKQILVNLLSNALKFTSEGFVRLKVHQVGGDIVYTVDDSGIGIREENRPKLFKAFSQGDSSINRKFGGSGLGLALSKELAQALGGDVVIEPSVHGRGSRFVFRFPLVHVSNFTTQQNPVDHDELLLKGKRFLLVEDAPDNQYLIQVILKKYGIDIVVANNGREGVDKALETAYDLILMDIQMPEMDGYAAFQELQSKGFRVPIVALTAHSLKEEREKALALGFSAYLTKPIDRAQLVKTCAQLVGLRASI